MGFLESLAISETIKLSWKGSVKKVPENAKTSRKSRFVQHELHSVLWAKLSFSFFFLQNSVCLRPYCHFQAWRYTNVLNCINLMSIWFPIWIHELKSRDGDNYLHVWILVCDVWTKSQLHYHSLSNSALCYRCLRSGNATASLTWDFVKMSLSENVGFHPTTSKLKP